MLCTGNGPYGLPNRIVHYVWLLLNGLGRLYHLTWEQSSWRHMSAFLLECEAECLHSQLQSKHLQQSIGFDNKDALCHSKTSAVQILEELDVQYLCHHQVHDILLNC